MDSGEDTSLGGFLRRHRAATRPEQVGLVASGRRRVPGLRRDEVARLAGLSPSYYTDLERGARTRPSPQAVEGLARALRLDERERARLYRLARPAARRRPARHPARRERVSVPVLRLVNGWTDIPALVLGRTQDILARNELAAALHRHFTHDDNLLRMIFLDPQGASFFLDWERVATASVTALRAAAARSPADPGLVELVGELSIMSTAFRRIWAADRRTRVVPRGLRLFHPDVGRLELAVEVLPVLSAPGQRLVTGQALAGSASADALDLLGALTADPLVDQS
ncbi:helix-turn-helix transcriptional regulator [Actinomadura kijaniata]|uniref:helix-turn-helix transcriptional regulator n=1 Tax=Actinomadura kijaniata TaxID=46161 RepID=UPI003F1A8FB1